MRMAKLVSKAIVIKRKYKKNYKKLIKKNRYGSVLRREEMKNMVPITHRAVRGKSEESQKRKANAESDVAKLAVSEEESPAAATPSLPPAIPPAAATPSLPPAIPPAAATSSLPLENPIKSSPSLRRNTNGEHNSIYEFDKSGNHERSFFDVSIKGEKLISCRKIEESFPNSTIRYEEGITVENGIVTACEKVTVDMKSHKITYYDVRFDKKGHIQSAKLIKTSNNKEEYHRVKFGDAGKMQSAKKITRKTKDETQEYHNCKQSGPTQPLLCEYVISQANNETKTYNHRSLNSGKIKECTVDLNTGEVISFGSLMTVSSRIDTYESVTYESYEGTDIKHENGKISHCGRKTVEVLNAEGQRKSLCVYEGGIQLNNGKVMKSDSFRIENRNGIAEHSYNGDVVFDNEGNVASCNTYRRLWPCGSVIERITPLPDYDPTEQTKTPLNFSEESQRVNKTQEFVKGPLTGYECQTIVKVNLNRKEEVEREETKHIIRDGGPYIDDTVVNAKLTTPFDYFLFQILHRKGIQLILDRQLGNKFIEECNLTLLKDVFEAHIKKPGSIDVNAKDKDVEIETQKNGRLTLRYFGMLYIVQAKKREGLWDEEKQHIVTGTSANAIVVRENHLEIYTGVKVKEGRITEYSALKITWEEKARRKIIEKKQDLYDPTINTGMELSDRTISNSPSLKTYREDKNGFISKDLDCPTRRIYTFSNGESLEVYVESNEYDYFNAKDQSWRDKKAYRAIRMAKNGTMLEVYIDAIIDKVGRVKSCASWEKSYPYRKKFMKAENVTFVSSKEKIGNNEKVCCSRLVEYEGKLKKGWKDKKVWEGNVEIVKNREVTNFEEVYVYKEGIIETIIFQSGLTTIQLEGNVRVIDNKKSEKYYRCEKVIKQGPNIGERIQYEGAVKVSIDKEVQACEKLKYYKNNNLKALLEGQVKVNDDEISCNKKTEYNTLNRRKECEYEGNVQVKPKNMDVKSCNKITWYNPNGQKNFQVAGNVSVTNGKIFCDSKGTFNNGSLKKWTTTEKTDSNEIMYKEYVGKKLVFNGDKITGYTETYTKKIEANENSFVTNDWDTVEMTRVERGTIFTSPRRETITYSGKVKTVKIGENSSLIRACTSVTYECSDNTFTYNEPQINKKGKISACLTLTEKYRNGHTRIYRGVIFVEGELTAQSASYRHGVREIEFVKFPYK